MNQPLLASLFDETERQPVSVSELTASIRGALEKRFASVWVEGEISNFRAQNSGHWYFTLKDEFAQLRSACYRSSNQRIRFRPEDGLQVRARGRVSVYEPKGEYQLIVETLEPLGAGALQLAFEQTKTRLQAEGLFAAELKRAIPMFPRRVGIVTSPTGAAIRDIINVISRRTRTVHVLFSPARVQGDGASSDIARAIQFINLHHRRALAEGRKDDAVDVLIVGRGGGSTEDLWAFNEEEVARAIRASEIPVISAVGHETDFTIADFTADLRAPTPSAAAELVAAQEDEICTRLEQLATNLPRLVRFKIIDSRTRVQEYAMSQAFDEVHSKLRDAKLGAARATHELQTLMRAALQTAQRRADVVLHKLSPAQLRALLSDARMSFDSAYAGCSAATVAQLEAAHQRLGLAAAALDALSPLAVLQRGYAIAQDKDGQLLRDSRSVSIGDPVRLRLGKGRLNCRGEGSEET